MEEEKEEEKEETTGLSQKVVSSAIGVISPEGLLVLPYAILLDAIGFLCLFIFDDYYVLDTIAFFTIGIWVFLKSGTLTGTKGAQELAKRILKRFGIAFVIELIPVVGSACPSWTVATWRTLRDSISDVAEVAEKEPGAPKEQQQPETQNQQNKKQ